MQHSLSTLCSTICGSINLQNFEYRNEIQDIQKLITIFESYLPLKDYYFIFHDDTETLHFHYIVKLTKRVRLSTFLNWLSDNLGVNPLAINIDKCTSLCSYLRYMLHIDDSSKIEGKKVFELKDIFSNLDYKNVQLLLESDDEENLSVEYLISLIVQYPYNSDLMKILGLSTYHKYRYEIKELRDEEYRFKHSYVERNSTER